MEGDREYDVKLKFSPGPKGYRLSVVAKSDDLEEDFKADLEWIEGSPDGFPFGTLKVTPPKEK